MSSGRHALTPTRFDRRPIRVLAQPSVPGSGPQGSPRHGWSATARRRAAITTAALGLAFGITVTSAMSATASPLGTGEAAALDAATTTAVVSQTYRVGDVNQQSVSWDSYAATSAAAVRAHVSSSEVAAAITAARAQLATSASRSETASEIATTTTLKSGDGAAMVAYALQYVGEVPYVLGGTSPSVGFSCDTFVEYVYAAFGTVMTGDVDAIATHATVISASEAKAGDLVYYPHQHIGIYDGAGGIIDAPKPGRTISHRAVWGSPEYLRITS